MFVGDAQSDAFFPGQAKELADALGSTATYYFFENEDGAGAHCQVGATFFSNQVAFDWFEEHHFGQEISWASSTLTVQVSGHCGQGC